MTFYEGKLYIFGGYDSKDNHKDLYEFNLRDLSWTRIQARGSVPSARNGHTASLYSKAILLRKQAVHTGRLAGQWGTSRRK